MSPSLFIYSVLFREPITMTICFNVIDVTGAVVTIFLFMIAFMKTIILEELTLKK